MIIFRNLEDRLFTGTRSDEVDTLLDHTFAASMEIMKLIEFKEKCGGRDIKHWFDVVTGIISNKIGGYYVKSHMAFIGALSDKDAEDLIKSDYQKVRRRFGSPEDFIDSLRKGLETTDNGKYRPFLIAGKKFLDITNEQYMEYFKYITLCLAEEMEPDDWDPWSLWDGRMMNMRIPRDHEIDPNKIRPTLESCIENITKYISY